MSVNDSEKLFWLGVFAANVGVVSCVLCVWKEKDMGSL